jgi:glutaminase
MGATLAGGGVHPLTGEQVVSAATCQRVLAVMATAGLYERSGSWLYDVGLPGKSGVSGGILTIAPGKARSRPFRRHWMPPATACAGSLSCASCQNDWG